MPKKYRLGRTNTHPFPGRVIMLVVARNATRSFGVQQMKLLKSFGMAVILSGPASNAQAEQTVTFEGQVYPLSILTENCNSKADDPQAMIACFNELSALLEQQSGNAQEAEAQTAETQDADKQEAERREAELREAERQEAERREAELREAERQEAERREAERQEADRQEAERQKADLAAERKEAERQKAERLEAERQEAERQRKLLAVPQALKNLQALAQYQDQDSGLSIVGTDCTVRFVYFGNYYHLSRRNVSTLDLISAEFDASNLQYNQISQVPAAQVPVLRGVLVNGATAVFVGGVEMDSSVHNFDPKSARSTLADYAEQVVGQLSPREGQTFDFVLVHPARSQSATEIHGAFEALVNACTG